MSPEIPGRRLFRAWTAAVLLAALVGGQVTAQERGVGVESRVGGETAPAPARVALVVGNDAYAMVPLRNAVNDARAMAAVLEELGFAVETVTDADRRTLEQAVERFAGRIGREATALFYYAGHGMQVEGENYLLPVDFRAASEE